MGKLVDMIMTHDKINLNMNMTGLAKQVNGFDMIITRKIAR